MLYGPHTVLGRLGASDEIGAAQRLHNLMQKIIILAGPNGAGKTSFANEYLTTAKELLVYVNADEIARAIADRSLTQEQTNIQAGRQMLARLEALAESGADFMFETTLASLSYAQKIRAWQARGSSVALIYLRLPNVDMSIERVRRRVAAGGHDVPENVIRTRFTKSTAYLELLYKPIVNEWYIWDSLEGGFQPIEAWDD
jgi:predicted ABC-type ATPase